MTTLEVEAPRLERVLQGLDGVSSSLSDDEAALFADLMREGLRQRLSEDLVQKAEAEVSAGDGPEIKIEEATAKAVADKVMAYRDSLTDDEDKRLVDSIIVDAAAPKDDDEVAGHYWVLKWDIGAPTSSALYTFYRGMCSNSGFGRSTYLQANFGTFWTHYRCWVWY